MIRKYSDEPPIERKEFDYGGRDRRYWQKLEELCQEYELGVDDILMHFPSYIRRRDLTRFLTHYELFQHVVDLPGCIVELGVFKGASFFTWAHLLETFCTGDRTKRVYGFDHFQGLVDFTDDDGAEHEYAEKVVGGWQFPAKHARVLTELHNEDCVLPNIERCHLVEGDVMETLPKFLEEHPGLKIPLLHLDIDLYRPTKLAMELLYPLVVKGGVVVLDEYGLMPWQGETRAVDEYFEEQGIEPPVIKKFPFSSVPAYFIK